MWTCVGPDTLEDAVVSGTLRGGWTLDCGRWEEGARGGGGLPVCLPMYLNQVHVLQVLDKKQEQYDRNIHYKGEDSQIGRWGRLPSRRGGVETRVRGPLSAEPSQACWGPAADSELGSACSKAQA